MNYLSLYVVSDTRLVHTSSPGDPRRSKHTALINEVYPAGPPLPCGCNLVVPQGTTQKWAVVKLEVLSKGGLRKTLIIVFTA